MPEKRGFNRQEAIEYLGVKGRFFDLRIRPILAAARMGTAVVFDDFHQSLIKHSKQTPYPRAELERIRARTGQREGFTPDIS